MSVLRAAFQNRWIRKKLPEGFYRHDRDADGAQPYRAEQVADGVLPDGVEQEGHIGPSASPGIERRLQVGMFLCHHIREAMQSSGLGPLGDPEGSDFLRLSSLNYRSKTMMSGDAWAIHRYPCIFQMEATQMKSLDVQDRLEYARCGVAVLRALKIAGHTMRYQQFAKAIGLMADDEPWEIRYREQVRAILQIMAAVEHQGLGGRREETEPLDFDLIVNEAGEPGIGVEKNSRIVQD